MFEFATSDSITDFLEKIDAVEGVTVILLDPVEVVTLWFSLLFVLIDGFFVK